MPITPTYPGVYIQEAPNNTHTIVAAPTNIAVFIGYTHPLQTLAFNTPVLIFGFSDYMRNFGGFIHSEVLAAAGDAYAFAADGGDPTTTGPARVVAQDAAFGDMAQAVNNFFLNGGSRAYVVGLQNTSLPLNPQSLSVGPVSLQALEITDNVFTMSLAVTVNPSAGGSPPTESADVVITYGYGASGAPAGNMPGSTRTLPPFNVTETYRRVTATPTAADGTPDPNYILTRLSVSRLVQATPGTPGTPFTTFTMSFGSSLVPSATPAFSAIDFTSVMEQDSPLDKVPIFNLMVIPGVTNNLVMSTARAFCERKLAFYIMDALLTDSADGSTPMFPVPVQTEALSGDIPQGANCALYFPYLTSDDPVTGSAYNASTGDLNEIPPSPTVAGLYAATDVARGVWKAPAGLQVQTINATGVADRGRMTDMRQGVLNLLNIDCLREFPGVSSPIVWGARTFQAPNGNMQYLYVPVRRMALFLEQTLYSNLAWVVFEPNAEPLWSAITTSITAFMLGLFRQNAFAGTTPSQAFSVQCNSQTTTQADIDSGIVNIVVAFAPLKPAEFVIITIAQLAGQTQTS